MKNLEAFERRAVILDRGTDPEDRRGIARDVMDLAALERPAWRERQRAIRASGVPTAMPTQGFRSLVGPEPPLANQTAISGVAVETAVWDAANLTPLQASTYGGLQADQVFKVTAYGVMTTAVTGSQTLTVTPRFGTTTGGTALGASQAHPLAAKVFTNTNWLLEMWVHFRTVGSSGTATCVGRMSALPIVGVAASTVEGGNLMFGTGSATATTVNTTTAQGLFVGFTPSLSTQAYTCLGVIFESLN